MNSNFAILQGATALWKKAPLCQGRENGLNWGNNHENALSSHDVVHSRLVHFRADTATAETLRR